MAEQAGGETTVQELKHLSCGYRSVL